MKNKKGFTLIELMVVVAIMGLLAALAVIALNSARARARDARRVSDVKQIQTALELYYLDNNAYPVAPAAPGIIEEKCISSGGIDDVGSCSGTTYMSITPSNPIPRNDGDCAGINTSYTYAAVALDGNNTSYYITYCLGAKTGDVDAGEHRATPAGLVDD